MTRVLLIQNEEVNPKRKVRIELVYTTPLPDGSNTAFLANLDAGEGVKLAVYDGVELRIKSIYD